MTVADLTESLKGLASGVKNVMAAANLRRVIVKNSRGMTFLEAPVTIAAIVTIVAPVVIGLGAIAALILDCSLAIEKRQIDGQPPVPVRPKKRLT